jgi:hypothetical protein
MRTATRGDTLLLRKMVVSLPVVAISVLGICLSINGYVIRKVNSMDNQSTRFIGLVQIV